MSERKQGVPPTGSRPRSANLGRSNVSSMKPGSSATNSFCFRPGLPADAAERAARYHLARHYLNKSALELNEAAYLLGYDDSNSFVRAFRTWEGVPPGRWREKTHAKVAL